MAEDLKEQSDVDTPDSVFPLPLTPLEKFFLWDDRPVQPLSAFFHLSFGSPIDVPVMESCISKVLERNPLLRAYVTGDDRDLSWALCEKPFRFLSLTDEPPIVNGMIRPFDLRAEVGCRFWCESTAECSRITMQLHHSVCDGIAFRSVCIDILHLYALATGNEAELSQQRSKFYDRFRYTLLHDRYNFEHLGKPKRETTTWQRIKNAWYFHFQPPTPLAKARVDQSSWTEQVQSANALCNLLMDRGSSQRIFRTCQSKEYKLNDVAIAILFRTCLQWNRKYGDTRRNRRLRILMPCDLRGRTDVGMPAANRLSFTFLGRDYSQCENLDELIHSVQAELRDSRETHLYLDLLNGLAFGCKWPRFMKWALRKHNSMATAVITYTGDLSRGMTRLFPEVNEHLRIGDTTLSSTMGAPPPRRNTNISMAICINWGRIYISSNWNRDVFSEQDCREFLELYETGWQQWCEAEESHVGVYAEPESV